MIKTAVLDDLTIHKPSDSSVPYILKTDGVTGLGEPTFRVTAYERAGEDGGTVASAFLGMRPITLSGVLRASDAATFMSVRRALELTCAIERDSYQRPVLKTLTVTAIDDSAYTVQVIPRKLVVGVQQNNVAPFLIELLAPDPVLSSTVTSSSGQVTPPLASGVAFPWVFDPTIEFGTTSGGSVAITNPGTYATWPIIYLRGAMTNPTVSHVASGRYIQLNATLGASDVVVIDMKQKTIVLNGSTSYLYTKTTDSNWFSLAPDNNLINFTTGSAADTGTMEVTYAAGYMGI